jgi:hypothetical protein
MIRQLAQHATTTIRVIIMLPTWVIDGILAAAMRLALQQAQLTQQRRMIRQSHQSAREQRDAFQINLALGLVALHVADAGLQPSARHPLGGIGIAVHHADTVLAAQFGVFQRDRMRVELALRASDQIEHVLLAVEVDFTSADLSGADLSDADLRGAKPDPRSGFQGSGKGTVASVATVKTSCVFSSLICDLDMPATSDRWSSALHSRGGRGANPRLRAFMRVWGGVAGLPRV